MTPWQMADLLRSSWEKSYFGETLIHNLEDEEWGDVQYLEAESEELQISTWLMKFLYFEFSRWT
jgi:hypothetical protein